MAKVILDDLNSNSEGPMKLYRDNKLAIGNCTESHSAWQNATYRNR